MDSAWITDCGSSMLMKRRFIRNAPAAISDRGYRAVEISAVERSAAGFFTEKAKMAPMKQRSAPAKNGV